MNTAKLVRMLEDFQGVAALYEMNPPFGGNQYVVASSVVILGTPECYLFPATPEGVSVFDELPGSQRGTVDHAVTLGGIGYEIR